MPDLASLLKEAEELGILNIDVPGDQLSLSCHSLDG
jgi:hypothetical protein